jgi:hypothetical protein
MADVKWPAQARALLRLYPLCPSDQLMSSVTSVWHAAVGVKSETLESA